MSLIKMTSRSPKAINHDDIVVRRAQELRITPEEVFIQAYAESAGEASSGSHMFIVHYYPGREGQRFHIPEVVRRFCERPLPRCENPNCTHPQNGKRKPALSVVGDQGAIRYFCSVECRDLMRDSEEAPPALRVGKQIFFSICAAISNATLVTVPQHQIRRMPDQPRKYFDPQRLQSLADSMALPRQHGGGENVTGQLMPGFIRSVPEDGDGCIYELLDGERRLQAVRMAGIPVYRAMLVELDDLGARHVVSIMANFNREGHTVLELADTVKNLHEEFGFSHHEIGPIIGKHYIQVLDLYRLRNLIPEVRDMLDPEKVEKKKKLLTQGAAIEIAKMPSYQQLSLARQSIEGELKVDALKSVVRESRPGNARAISTEERRRAVEGNVRRFLPAARNLHTAMKKGGEAEALGDFSPEERQQLLATLKEASQLLQQSIDYLESVPESEAAAA